MSILRRARMHYRQHGAFSLIPALFSTVYREWYLPIMTAIADRILGSSDEFTLLFKLRSDGFEAASVSLLHQLNEGKYEDYDLDAVVFAVESLPEHQEKATPLRRYLEDELAFDVAVVEIGTQAFSRRYRNSDVVIITSITDLWPYRFLCANANRLLVHTYHGVITKSYGNLDGRNIQEATKRTTLPSHPYGFASRFDRLDVKSVASETERHFKMAAEARRHSVFKIWGYPRFDRIHQILNDQTWTPILPDETRDTLEADDSSVKLLYAPTHFDDIDVHPFRLADFDIGEFGSLLDQYDITIYMRMHFGEESDKNYQEFTEHDRIRYAGYDFAPSPVELLEYFDGLITDYSSMYVDFLRFERPCIFIRGEHHRFMHNRGLSFEDDTFFPGPKVHDFEEFLAEIRRLAEGGDEYENQRELVEQTLLPEQQYQFLDNVLSAATEIRS